jgi:outer membrane protein assembly factor BamE (lipoprotein component of BamABCDE complex)
MMQRQLCALALAAVAALSGCAATSSLQTGMTRDQVLAKWGKPLREVPISVGERLQYTQQPSGQEAFNVDLDKTGHVVSVDQVLFRANFARISTAGDWTKADVEREFGPSGKIEHVSRWDGPIMAYRFREGMNDLMFWVYLDNAGVVRRAHEGIDWRNQRSVRG